MFDPFGRRRVKRTGRSHLRQPGGDLAAYWALRILVDLGAWKGLLKGSSLVVNDEPVFRLIGLEPEAAEGETDELSKKALLRHMKKRMHELEYASLGRDDPLAQNLGRLGELVGLSGIEQSILAFALLLKVNKGLGEVTDLLGELTKDTLVTALSTVLDETLAQVHKALSAHGLLSRSGLLRWDRRVDAHYLSMVLEPLEGLAGALLESDAEPGSILSRFFQVSAEATLAPQDFAHLDKRYRLTKRHLAQALRTGSVGTNLLLYGRPGTGKTELARTFAKTLGVELYEVAFADDDGDPFDGKTRLQAYQLCQQFLAREKNRLILFDEIEDVFEGVPHPMFRTRQAGNKAWINRLLEENPVPAIWICNSIDPLDPAYIRRFDIVLELDQPPRKTRARILRQHLDGLPVSPQWVEHAAENPDIAPAMVARAAKVVAAAGRRSTQTVEADLEDVLGGTLAAMGYGPRVITTPADPIAYRLDALNPDQDLERLLHGLQKRPRGRICLYGPPGSGKSGFGRHLAQRLERPLMLQRASDLLTPYVGETEQRIAAMFRQAEADEAVLMLDEADSFLMTRLGANHSWEVTRVNELLTQMESFDGLFVCSTNLMDNLDEAALRRFDLKIRFGYLRTEQAWVLFKQIVGEKKIGQVDKEYWRGRLGQLEDLTPGDFAVVVRRSRMLWVGCDPKGLLSGLEEEVAFKLGGRGRGIGFSANL